MPATDTFRTPPYMHNCAQAVANQWKSLYPEADIVTSYAPYVGGHAPGGLCGALYAAMQAVPERREEIRWEFEQRAGAATCREIKGGTRFPCHSCVALGDELVRKYHPTGGKE